MMLGGLNRLTGWKGTKCGGNSYNFFSTRKYSAVSNSKTIPKASFGDKTIEIQWSNGDKDEFHNIWLRDHCKCSSCLHQITRQRLLNTFAIPFNIKPSQVHSYEEGMDVTWEANESNAMEQSGSGKENAKNHVSSFSWNWLKNHSYHHTPTSPPSFASLLDKEAKDKVLWNAKWIENNIPTVEYKRVMQTKEGLLEWLENIHKFGFSFVSGVPVTTEDTEKLSRRIAHIRETHYGGFWDFTADLAHGDTAYTNLALQAHTDTTYFTDPIGLQMFHLLHHSGEGGQSLLVDGFYCANLLKEQFPKAYETLSTISIPAHAAGDENHLLQPTPQMDYPLLRHDSKGNLYQIRYNNDDRSVMSHIKYHQVEEFYDALRKWNQIISDSQNGFGNSLYPEMY
eukprot:TRINITY_DN8365_c0_g1_i1.p1 TRINITY_DN8365_c0_g1~~TRINITY_DN8365_c0_g1_i1.p1  ORF type:complete len:396 (+),score=122.59 TRINITY_DN8365_c0_g1_i1:74-1261(+)